MSLKVVKVNLLAEEIVSFFEDNLNGIYSDLLWYDLLDNSERYITRKTNQKEFLNYLIMVFSFDDKNQLETVRRRAYKRYRKLRKV